MKVFLAELEDLKEIKDMYKKIVKNMNDNNIKIWNDYYPNEVFESDIKNKSLYLLKEDNKILGAFVLLKDNEIVSDLKWKNISEEAYVINRLGVNVEYLHQGIGQKLIEEACKIVKSKSAKYLRLLVSDINIPAIKLYLKCGFNKVDGVHIEKINDYFLLTEYGFEKNID